MEGLVWEFERNPEKAPMEDDTSSIEEIMVIEDVCNNEYLLTVFTRNIRPSFFPSQLNRNPTLLFLRPFTIPVFTTSLAAKVLVSSTAFVETHPTICKQQNLYQWEPVVVEKEDSGSDNVLACPICYDPLTWTVCSPSYVGSKSGSNLQCKTCKKSYFGNQTHLDLVASGGSKQYDNSMPLATELFRTPVVSFLYERGWRQNFIFGGFPGPGKEFEIAKKYLKPVLGGNIVDASCGSGLFSRLLPRVDYFRRKVTLVRADISRLPFKSSSVDALHAGAALHCWPSPSTAVAEINRVLLVLEQKQTSSACILCNKPRCLLSKQSDSSKKKRRKAKEKWR
ncbi:hypothetical protein Gotri_022560 [Gossypium trilobum]|uniref:Methyltransferase type 11 domain-containing protein n=1 Tax=Gossypium trilobum TaxID=34281 RepID=A0A7J9DG36_9ROSI|nr:hypothetical protein [Gossypium trilobum]